MKKLILPLLLMMSVVAGGCQGTKNANEKAYDLRNRIEGNDMTNQNPNFLDLHGTRNGDESGGAGNTGVDVAMVKRVIADTKEFRTESVQINGDRMWVTVFKNGKFSERDRRDAEARLHRKLIQALPRYNINVSVR